DGTVVADRRGVPSPVRGRRVPYAGRAVPGSADDATRMRVEMGSLDDTPWSVEHGHGHSQRGVRHDGGPVHAAGEHELRGRVELDRSDDAVEVVALAPHGTSGRLEDVHRAVMASCGDQRSVWRPGDTVHAFADLAQVTDPLAIQDVPDRRVASC